MLVYIIRRLLALIPVWLGVLLVVSLLIHLVPGDPVDLLLGDYATLEDKTKLREQLGLHVPFYQQFLTYINQVLHGDFGRSLIYQRPVSSMIAERFFPTMELAFIGVFVALIFGLVTGLISALHKDKPLDYFMMGFSLLGVAIPNFWLGPLLVLFFSLYLEWLPVSERGDWSSYVLPSLTLGIALASILSRMTRASVLEHLKEDYVRTAKAKGLPFSVVLFKHVLLNAAIPLVTLLGLQFGVLLTGAVITERIFDWPGLGSLMLEALNSRDYPLVQGCILMFSSTYLVVNLLTDIVYAFLDPRMKWDKSS